LRVPDAGNGVARLLVVDDNKVNRLLLTRNLDLMGHRVSADPSHAFSSSTTTRSIGCC